MTPSLRIWLWTALLAVIIGATLPAPAFPQTYIRGGVLLDRGQDTRFQDEDCSSEVPPALYGCGSDMNGAPLSSLGDFGTMTGLELGLGYAILPALRLEAAIQYRPDFSFKGGANFTQTPGRQDVSAELSALSGMLAAYLDVPIPGFALLRYTPINPFIGVGGGLSRIDIDTTRMNFSKTSTIIPGGHQVSFSWMLTAGLAVSLTRWTVDIAWRYTDHGAIETGKGGEIVCRVVGNCESLNLDLLLPDGVGETRGDLRSHGFTVSLRYAF